RSYRIFDLLGDYAVDFAHLVGTEGPAHNLLQRIELRGPARAPQSDADAGLIQHPSEGQMDHAFAIILAGEAVKFSNRMQVLFVAGRLELGVGPAQIIAAEPGAGLHPSA